MNKKQNLFKQIEACSETLNTLDKRTERFATFRKKKDAEVIKLRQKAQTAVVTLDRKHAEKLAKAEATHFKKARAQAKEIVSLKSDVVEQTHNVRREVSLLVETYHHKITAIE